MDLIYNNLSTLNLKYFQNLTNLKILDLESTFLINFEFIYYLNPFLEEINLNNNRLEEDSYFFLKMLLNLKVLNLVNTSLKSLDNIFSKTVIYNYQLIDLSFNNSTRITDFSNNAVIILLRENNIEFI